MKKGCRVKKPKVCIEKTPTALLAPETPHQYADAEGARLATRLARSHIKPGKARGMSGLTT